MAAGSSAPELATVIIAVFSTKDDIGISDVIGSAVFNMLFVIALCGLFGNASLQVNWWPLLRNCFFYTVSIMILLLAIANEQVSWLFQFLYSNNLLLSRYTMYIIPNAFNRLESGLLIGTYAVYCVALYYNELLEAWAHTLPLPFNTSHENITEESDANYIPLKDRRSSIHVSPNERTSIQSNGKIIISNSDIQPTYRTSNDTGSLSQV